MGKYVKQNLGKNETVVKKAELNPLSLVFTWVFAILFFWLLLIPVIKAIIITIRFVHVELGVTNKRVVGKVGVFNTKSLDAPLNKTQNVKVEQKLGGNIFNYGDIHITTAADSLVFICIKNPNAFKGVVMSRIEVYEEERVHQQAEMASAIKS